jgi:hypothetical protein
MLRSCALAVAVSWISLTVGATPLTQQEIVSLCGNAGDAAHCGRLIEEVQLKRLPISPAATVLSGLALSFGQRDVHRQRRSRQCRSYSL